MRLLLIFLIILNLLYAGWVYFSPAPTDNSLSPVVGDLKQLELLNEKERVTELELAESEQGTAGQPDVADIDTGSGTGTATGSETNASLSLSCYTVGPFKDRSVMQQLRDSLSDHVSDVRVRKLTESEKHRYWVYLPALSSRKQAKAMAARLREKKIEDFYIVLKGDNKHSISLGHFREQKHANRRRKGLGKLGFDVEIDVIYRDLDVYWLDYRLSGPESDPGFELTEYVTEGVSQISRACDQDSPE